MFAAISIEYGKVLDEELVPCYCKGCNFKKDLKVKKPTAYAEWKNAQICQYDHKGSA